MINNYFKKQYLKIFYYGFFLNFYTNSSNVLFLTTSKESTKNHNDVPKNSKIIFYSSRMLQILYPVISNFMISNKIKQILHQEEYLNYYIIIIYNIIIFFKNIISLFLSPLEELVSFYNCVVRFIFFLVENILFIIMFKSLQEQINNQMKGYNSYMFSIQMSELYKIKDKIEEVEKKFIIFLCINLIFLILDFVISYYIRNIIQKNEEVVRKYNNNYEYYIPL